MTDFLWCVESVTRSLLAPFEIGYNAGERSSVCRRRVGQLDAATRGKWQHTLRTSGLIWNAAVASISHWCHVCVCWLVRIVIPTSGAIFLISCSILLLNTIGNLFFLLNIYCIYIYCYSIRLIHRTFIILLFLFLSCCYF